MWTLLEAKPASSRKRSSDALLMPSSTWRLAVVTWELPSMANCLGSTNDFIKAIDSKPNVLPRVPNTLLAPLNVWKLCVIYIYIHYMYVFNDMFSISYMLWYAIYIYKILQASPWTHSILQIMWIVLWASKSRLVEWVPSLGTVVLCTLAGVIDGMGQTCGEHILLHGLVDACILYVWFLEYDISILKHNVYIYHTYIYIMIEIKRMYIEM